MLQVYVDGSYRPKHSLMACAVVWYQDDVLLDSHAWVIESAHDLHSGVAAAEAIAMEVALKSLARVQRPNEPTVIYSDNRSVVNGLNGQHDKPLLPLLRTLWHYIQQPDTHYGPVSVRWISRDQNEEAHRLCGAALHQWHLAHDVRSA